MIKNKKGIVLKFLLGLIFAIVSLVTVALIFKSCVRITGLGEQSFNQLVELIERVKVEEGAESMPLHMDRSTAVIGFTSNAQYVKNTQYSKIRDKQIPREEHYFWKPKECEENKACICLCESGWKRLSTNPKDNPHNVPNEYKCNKIICKSIESINFIDKIKSEDFGAYYGSPSNLLIDNLEGIYKLEGGFVYLRTTDTDMGFPGWSTSPNTVYVENYKNIISVCFKYPCISEEMKNERFPITIDEFGKAKFMFTDGWMIGIDTDSDGTLETFYYITEILKDSFGNYYYEYKFGIRPQSAPEQASFLETIQEKSKEEFESRFINYAKGGKLVQIDYDNEKVDINNFKPETRMDKEGKVIMVGITGGQ